MDFAYGSYGYIACRDLQKAHAMLELFPDGSVTYSQQAVEKILKHWINETMHTEEVESLLKSHKLVRLLACTTPELLSQYRGDLSELTAYYFDSRYPGINYTEASLEDATHFYQCAKQLIDDVSTLIQKTN